MDFLNKSFAQLADLFRSMTVGSRLTSAMLLIVVVVSLAFLFQHQMAGGDTFLLGARSFSSSELPLMEAAFAKEGLSGYSVESNRVRIPQGQQAEYLAALANDNALPVDFGTSLTAAVAKISPFSGRIQQEAMLKAALQSELANIIRNMTGIENASVNYDEQKQSGFRQTAVSTASVSVKPQGREPLGSEKVYAIRHLVAGAIAGLKPESVTVTDLNTGRVSAGSADGTSASDDPVLDRTRQWQLLYEDKIRGALGYVPGVTVTALVQLDNERRHLEERVSVDPKTVALSRREEFENSNTEGEARGGAPGLLAQQPNAPNRLTQAAKGPTSTLERSTSDIQNVTSHDRTTIERAPYTPNRVTVSIGVPSSYFEQIWYKRNPPSAGQAPPVANSADLEQIKNEETIKIRDHVMQVLPTAAPNVDPASLVKVTAFQAVTTAELPEIGVTEYAGTWLAANWSTLGMFALVAISLLMLRSIVRGGQPASAAPSMSEAQAAAAAEEAREEQPEPEPVKQENRFRRRVPGRSLQEDLTEMVREDPDAAANVLRNWIGSTS